MWKFLTCYKWRKNYFLAFKQIISTWVLVWMAYNMMLSLLLCRCFFHFCFKNRSTLYLRDLYILIKSDKKRYPPDIGRNKWIRWNWELWRSRTWGTEVKNSSRLFKLQFYSMCCILTLPYNNKHSRRPSHCSPFNNNLTQDSKLFLQIIIIRWLLAEYSRFAKKH